MLHSGRPATAARFVASARQVAEPSVSVIVPVKDTEPELLLRAVCSALHQAYAGDIDVVVLDDGSSARRYQFNRGLIAALPRPDGRRVRVARSPVNRGISITRNEASRLASGTWLLWLDSDDELPRTAVGALTAAAREDPRVRLVAGQCGVVFPGGTRVHRNDRFLTAWRELRRSRWDPALTTVFAVHGSLVHRDLFWQVDGFDPLMAFGELTDWFLRVLAEAHTHEVVTVAATTYVHHKRPASHSADRTQLEAHRQAALRRYAQAIGLNFQPGFRLGDRCLQSGARRYALLDEAGRTLVRAGERFSSLLHHTVEMDPDADGLLTEAHPIIDAAATSAPWTTGPGARPGPAPRHRAGTGGTGRPTGAGSDRRGEVAAG